MKITTEHHISDFHNISISGNDAELDLTSASGDEMFINIVQYDTEEEYFHDELSKEDGIVMRDFFNTVYPLSFKSIFKLFIKRFSLKKAC